MRTHLLEPFALQPHFKFHQIAACAAAGELKGSLEHMIGCRLARRNGFGVWQSLRTLHQHVPPERGNTPAGPPLRQINHLRLVEARLSIVGQVPCWDDSIYATHLQSSLELR